MNMTLAAINRKLRLQLTYENLAAIKILQRENPDWSVLTLNKFVNYVIADGIRVRLLAVGKSPVISSLLKAK